MRIGTSTPRDEPPVRTVLLSVGGAPAPILAILRKYQPKHVWYFCSAGSRATADEIHGQLDWHPDRDFIEVEQFEELGPCYRALREAIPDLLRKWNVPVEQVLVDYTGGTKTMSAALTLAATETFQRFSYVGGKQREKAGLGITVDGKERFVYQGNPWNELAVREVERARDLWERCQFDASAKIVQAVAERVPKRLRFEAIAKLARAMAARHRLDFRHAANELNPLLGKLPPLYDGQDDFGLQTFVKSARDLCHACSQDNADEAFLRELLDNTLRTAAQGRYEDAAARLYRAMEMQGQIWLAEKTGDLFKNGTCAAARVAEIPDVLTGRHDFCRAQDGGGGVKLSLEQIFRALATLGHAYAIRIVNDLDGATDGKGQSRWRSATEKRNASILAHGVLPIGDAGFEQMKQLAVEFLGFDLADETNRIPPLDPRWFA